MAVEIKTREELEKELSVKQQNLAVVEAKIKELSEELGVEPTTKAVQEALTGLESEKKELEAKIEKVLSQVEAIEVNVERDPEVKGNPLAGLEGESDNSELDEFNEE